MEALIGPLVAAGVVLGALIGVVLTVKALIIIVPPNTPHGWVNIPDHVDYLTFRPSPGILTAGYVHPSIRK